MKKISEKVVFDGEWISVYEQEYLTAVGDKVVWETVKRKKSTVGVIAVARLMPSERFILVKQFRPAVGGYVIGFPAGLAFDNPEHALVELKEETGYVGKIVAFSPVLKTGSSLINDSGRIVTIEVDENDPRNINPKQELEASEDIQVCLVKKEEAREFFIKEMESGAHVSSNLWYVFGI